MSLVKALEPGTGSSCICLTELWKVCAWRKLRQAASRALSQRSTQLRGVVAQCSDDPCTSQSEYPSKGLGLVTQNGRSLCNQGETKRFVSPPGMGVKLNVCCTGPQPKEGPSFCEVTTTTCWPMSTCCGGPSLRRDKLVQLARRTACKGL